MVEEPQAMAAMETRALTTKIKKYRPLKVVELSDIKVSPN